MKKFLSFVLKECRHILRDHRTMLILFGIPIIQITVFGFALTTEVHHVRLGVMNMQPYPESEQLIAQFDATIFEVSCRVNSMQEVERLFGTNELDAVLIFPSQYARSKMRGRVQIQLLIDGSDPNTARTIALYARTIAAEEQALGIETRFLYNPQSRSAFNFVPGIMGLVLMLICAMMTAISIVREKETGSMDVLLISPTPPIQIIMAKIVPYFLLSCLNIFIILMLSYFLLAVPIRGSLGLILLLSMLYVTVALMLGLLISNIAQTQVIALLASGMLLMMPTMLLSGMIYPIESMPVVLRGISYGIPARWYIAAVRKLMIEGVAPGHVWQEFAALGVMALLLTLVSLKTFKLRTR